MGIHVDVNLDQVLSSRYALENLEVRLNSIANNLNNAIAQAYQGMQDESGKKALVNVAQQIANIKGGSAKLRRVTNALELYQNDMGRSNGYFGTSIALGYVEAMMDSIYAMDSYFQNTRTDLEREIYQGKEALECVLRRLEDELNTAYYHKKVAEDQLGEAHFNYEQYDSNFYYEYGEYPSSNPYSVAIMSAEGDVAKAEREIGYVDDKISKVKGYISDWESRQNNLISRYVDVLRRSSDFVNWYGRALMDAQSDLENL